MTRLRILRGPTTWPVKVFLDPRVIGREQFGDRPDRNDLFVGNHRHPVADFIQRIQIVRDQENRQPQRLLQLQDQLVERGRTDRIKARRRLVQKQQFGIERQRPRQTRTLAHTAR